MTGPGGAGQGSDRGLLPRRRARGLMATASLTGLRSGLRLLGQRPRPELWWAGTCRPAPMAEAASAVNAVRAADAGLDSVPV